MSTKGRSDFYAPGDYNACCDRCCAKFKASKLRKDWQGFMLCEWCWEPRQPQDFVRGRADPAPLPWVRMCCGDSFVTFCVVPTANFTVTVDATNPLKIYYASTTPSSEACPVTCAYDFGDGTTSTSCSGDHTYSGDGAYTIVYTATNPGGSSTASRSVSVASPPPQERFYTIDFEEVSTNGSALAGPVPVASVAQDFTATGLYVWNATQYADPQYLANLPTGSSRGSKWTSTLISCNSVVISDPISFVASGINVGWKITHISWYMANFNSTCVLWVLESGVWSATSFSTGSSGAYLWQNSATFELATAGFVNVTGVRFDFSGSQPLVSLDEFTVRMIPV